MTKFGIGRHINTTHGFVTAPAYGKKIGCDIIQIFLGSPQQIISKPRSSADLKIFGQELSKYKLLLAIHGSYTINLCHPKGTRSFTMSVKSLVQDLIASELIGKRCIGVIIHMGKNVATNKISDKQALNNFIFGLKEALSKSPSSTTIILETGASQGTEIASTIDGLSEIYWALTKEERERISFCIDSCHIWATGYDISTPAGVKNFFTEFNEKIGIDRISCIQFNDSKTPLGSCVDRHADLGYGYIGTKGLKAFARYAKQHQIPLIMETPLDSVDPTTNKDVTFQGELTKIKSWLKST